MSDIKCTRRFVEPAKIRGLQALIQSSENDLTSLADLMQAAGNDTRLKILWLLTNEQELCPCDFADILGISVPAVSQQLQKLRTQGFVARRRDGVTIYYSLTDTQFTQILRTVFDQQIPEVTALYK
jgi:ArsR family transcriptional regulator, lead/cadmium/zinc/bismuth-responsive transcriptional repressor